MTEPCVNPMLQKNARSADNRQRLINAVNQDAEQSTTMTTMTTIPAAALQECSMFFYQNGLGAPWIAFYDGAMKKIAGTSTGGGAPGAPRKPPQSKRAIGTAPMSKTAEAIVAVLPPEGMSKRAIIAACGLTPKQVETGLPTMQKNGLIYLRNSRYFAGPNPAKAGAAGAATGKTSKKSSTKAPSELSEGALKAVRNLPQGSTNAQIQTYLADKEGITALSNHVGIALARHKRAGRLEQRGGVWYAPNVEDLRQAS